MNEVSGHIDKAQDPKSKKESVRKSTLKKLDLESAKALQAFKERANKKAYGRKVRDSEILALAIRGLMSDHLPELQEATYSERDRLQMLHEEYQKKSGKISLDQFIGKLIRNEIQK